MPSSSEVMTGYSLRDRLAAEITSANVARKALDLSVGDHFPISRQLTTRGTRFSELAAGSTWHSTTGKIQLSRRKWAISREPPLCNGPTQRHDPATSVVHPAPLGQ